MLSGHKPFLIHAILPIVLGTFFSLPVLAAGVVTTDAITYEQGSIVVFTFLNEGPECIETWGTPALAIQHVDTGTWVHGTSLPETVVMEPGDVQYYTHDTNGGGEPNPLGLYHCTVDYYFCGEYEVQYAHCEYMLTEPVATEQTTWSAVKSFYR